MPVLDAATESSSSRRFLLVAILAGLLLPLLIFQGLPWLGIEQPDELLTPMNIILIFAASVAGLGYWLYIRRVYETPGLLSFGAWLFYPWLGFLCHALMPLGIGISQNFLLIALLLVPAAFIGFKHTSSVWNRVPYIKLFIGFVLVMVLYYFFFQDDIQEERSSASHLTTLGFYYMFAMLMNLAQITLITIADKAPLFKQKFLKLFTWGVLGNVLLIGIIGIIGYPFPYFYMQDNFTRRACSIFYHPAYFAHYTAFGMIYLLGWFVYYKNLQKDKKILAWFLAACIIGFVGFLLTISKTAMLSLAITFFVMLVLNTTSWSKAIQQIKYGIIVLLVAVCAVVGYQVYSGNNIVASVLQRFDENRSMDWRERMNRYLELDADSIWIGHGMSSAKRRMSMFEGYNRDERDSSFGLMKVVHVHNSYLSQFYDYGFPGIALFIFLGVFLIRKVIDVIRTPAHYPNRMFNVTIVCLIIYFMLICMTETVFETPESPFWVILTATVLAEGRIRRQWT